MALDNAQFISELSITDPPGTDAVAEGDDHIRTTKRATQQSFPNVDAAVPQTAAQMGQMAIKNEVNIFTQTNNFTARQDFTGNIRVITDAASIRGVQWQDPTNTFREFDWVYNQPLRSLRLRRHDGAGAELDTPIIVDQATGDVTFPRQVIFDFVAQFNTTSARARANTASDRAGYLFISNSATLQWDIVMASADDSAAQALRIGRYSGGVFQDHVMEIFTSGSVLFRTAFLVIQRPSAVVSTQLTFQNETTNRWMWRFDVSTGRLQTVRLSGTGTEQDTPLQFRASDGVIIMNTLPTSDPGVSGGLFLSGGFIAVSP